MINFLFVLFLLQSGVTTPAKVDATHHWTAIKEVTIVHHYQTWDTDHSYLVYSAVTGDNGREIARFTTADKARAFVARLIKKHPHLVMNQAGTADVP